MYCHLFIVHSVQTHLLVSFLLFYSLIFTLHSAFCQISFIKVLLIDCQTTTGREGLFSTIHNTAVKTKQQHKWMVARRQQLP